MFVLELDLALDFVPLESFSAHSSLLDLVVELLTHEIVSLLCVLIDEVNVHVGFFSLTAPQLQLCDLCVH